jgi:hypothetical protein
MSLFEINSFTFAEKLISIWKRLLFMAVSQY